MDLNTALITGAGTVLCGVMVAIIFIFGFKEKTFEEALDEQRRGELLELIRGDKGRPKKQKKAGKKAKEKPSESKSTSETSRHAESTLVDAVDKPSHVEFKFPEAEVVSERPPAQLLQDESRKKRKRDRVRPILHNKEEHSPLADDMVDPPPANHFAEIHPKDDVLLKRRLSREEGSSPSSEEVISEPEEPVAQPVKVTKPERVIKAPATKVNGTKPGAGKVALNSEVKIGMGKLALNTPVPMVIQPAVITPVVMTSAAMLSAPPAPSVAPVVVKDRKKKKGDLASLHHMISKDAEGVTMSLLVPLVRKAELSRSEVHQLIEQLLNREQGGEHEWVEGRQDPVARLKKQLADKERALAEEQQGAQAVQAKLLELRAELNGERQRQGVMQRQLEEQLNSKQTELQTLAARLQLANDTHTKSVTAAQQVQAQLAEERKKVRKLTEEKAATQGSMSQEMELHIQNLQKHHQEEVSSLQTQMSAAQSQVAEIQNLLKEQTGQQEELRGELSRTQDLAEKHQQECLQVTQQLAHLETKLRLLQEQASSTKSAKDTELEEAYRVQTELELRVRSLEADIKRSSEETKSLSVQLEAARKASVTSTSATVDASDQTSSKISELESIIRIRDDTVSKLQADNKQHSSDLTQLKDELEAQRQKNNELRTKNWKAMEAVASAEKNLESKQKECERLSTNSGSEVREKEQAAVRELLQRIFPSVPSSDSKDHLVWVEKFEKAAQEWLSSELCSASELQQQTSTAQDESTQHVLAEVEKQNSQLQAMVTHYKTIIEDTEGMLNKLERHVEQEEARWRRQLQLKEEELDVVAAERDSLLSEVQQADQQQLTNKADELEVALTVLQGKLKTEEQQRISGEAQAKQLQTRLDELAAQVLVLEQAKEERDALALQLAKESSHSQQLVQKVRELEEAVAHRAHTNHLDPSKAKDQTNTTTNGPSIEPAISETRPVKRRRLTEWFRKKVSLRKRRRANTVPTESFKS